MDTPTLVIAVSASLLFFGVLIYKALWFIRKIQQAPDPRDRGPETAEQPRKEPEAASEQRQQ
ncbi:hypothetical protein NOR53_3307 [gamma proteobacterium NOR5-3]|nr:hypothetical protein NOR53_3307 [gamma proteobacterium NOR5-3]